MKKLNLTQKKKIWLFALALLALILLAIVINIQLNQPEDMHADYVGLWKSRWHEENKDWLYPLKISVLLFWQFWMGLV